MSLPAPTQSRVCAICGGLLADGPTIPTTSGSAVHIRCAEAQARAAARGRTVRATMTAGVFLVVEVGILSAGAQR